MPNPMTPEQQIAVLIAVIAEKNETIAELRDEIAELDDKAERYQRWWNETRQEAEELRAALGAEGHKSSQPI